MFSIKIELANNDDITLERNSYDECDFSFLVRQISKYAEYSEIVSISYVFKENIIDAFYNKGFEDSEEVENILFAILDEIDIQLKAISYINEKHYWKSSLLEQLEARESALLTIQDNTLYFIENHLQWLK